MSDGAFGIDDVGEPAEYALTQEALDEAIAHALADGFEVIAGGPDTLLVDLDNGAAINEDVLLEIHKFYGTTKMERWPSKSGSGEHVVVKFDGIVDPTGLTSAYVDLTPLEAVVLEVALGSDPRRAVFAVQRLRNGVAQPRVLFKPSTKPPVEALFGNEPDPFA